MFSERIKINWIEVIEKLIEFAVLRSSVRIEQSLAVPVARAMAQVRTGGWRGDGFGGARMPRHRDKGKAMTGAGTNHTRPSLGGGPSVVLVRPQLAVNIGMCARAMANFGLSDCAWSRPAKAGRAAAP